MNLIAIVIFIGIFAVVALLLVAGGSGAARDAKQITARLDSALATERAAKGEALIDLRKTDMLSAVPMVHRWLLGIKLAPRLQTMIAQANMKWTVGGTMMMCIIFFIIASYATVLKTGSVVISLLVGTALSTTPILLIMFKRSRRFAAFEKQLPDSLDMMVSALRVGHSLNAALGLVTRECEDPVRSEFKTCFDEQNYGLELRTAMGNLVERVPLQDLKIVVTAILIQKESGGNLAEVLDKTAHVIRERFRLKRQISTHTAQGRLTGWILSVMPIVLGFALYTINPENMRILWTNPIGIKLMWVAGAMTVVGSLIIRKIVNLDV